MILLLDQDGPLADFDQAFWNLCVSRGYEMDIEDLNDPRRRRFLSDNIVDPRARVEARRFVNQSRWFLDLPPVSGAREGVAELKEAGVDIWVCTKPLETNPTGRDDKAHWLAQYIDPDLVHKLIIAPNKGMVKGDILLDDAPKPGWFRYASWVPVLFPAPYHGPDSDWDGLPSWRWGDPIEDLLDHAR